MHYPQLKTKAFIQKYLDNQFTPEDLSLLIEYLQESDDYSIFEEFARAEWENTPKETDLSETMRSQLQFEAQRIIETHNHSQVRKKQASGTKKHFVRWVSSIAAVALILIGWVSYNKLVVEKIEYQSTVVPNGSKKEIVLPDGSNVHINSGSLIVSPNKFIGENRTIQLSGEAFFDIRKDKKKPFIVETGDFQIQVLGTSFNIKNYLNDDWLSVSVKTGRVAVELQGGHSRIELKVNEQLLVDKKTGSFKKEVVYMEQVTAWRKGELYFNKMPIQEVVNSIRREYSADIELERGEWDIVISGEHDNRSLESALESICFAARLKQKKEGNKVILYK